MYKMCLKPVSHDFEFVTVITRRNFTFINSVTADEIQINVLFKICFEKLK